MARNQEGAAEDAHRIAALKRRAAAEAKDVLSRADEAGREARRAVVPRGGPPRGTAPG